jgi:hypothetical protein
MVKVIQDVWIITENGINVFSRLHDESLNEQLFGALMSALNSFAEEISKGGLSNFQLSNKRFSIIKRNQFIFVASSNPKVKEKKAISELEIIIERFFNKFPHDLLDTWDSDVSIFKGFEQNIEDSLENTIDKFKQAFW